MRSVWCVVLGVTLAAAGCKIERTPQEYIDHRSPVEQVRSAAAEELNAQLAVMGQAFARGDHDAALTAVDLAPDAYLVSSSGSAPLRGEAAIHGAARDYLAARGPLRPTDSRIDVGPRGTSAWFLMELSGSEGGEERVRLTGVVVRGDEGDWELKQVHLSGPPPAPAATSPPR